MSWDLGTSPIHMAFCHSLGERILSSLRLRALFINRFVHESKNEEEAAKRAKDGSLERELDVSRLLIYEREMESLSH